MQIQRTPIIILTALALGALGDSLLRAQPGINLSLWFLAVLVGLFLLAFRFDSARDRLTWQLALAAVMAASFSWRASPALHLLTFLALLAAISSTALRIPLARLRTLSLLDAVLAAAAAALHSGLGAAALLATDATTARSENGRMVRYAPAALRGALIAVPLTIIFGALFAGADPVFASIGANLVRFDLKTVGNHLLLIGVLAWITGGFLRGVLAGPTSSLSGLPRQLLWPFGETDGQQIERLAVDDLARVRISFGLGTVELAIVLGLLDLLFLSFVVVQFRYFFGGSPIVQASTTLTYAEYARSGFFQLAGVTGLVLPLLLALDWLRREDDARSAGLFRLLASIQLALLAVIVVSALQRMRLYEAEYGLTELRLYATAGIFTIAAALLWFAVTVLRGKRLFFICGAAGVVLAALVLLYVINPSGLIVRTNADRAAAGRQFDEAAATSLGADAVPELVASLTKLHGDDACRVAGYLLQNWGQSSRSWRSWTIAEAQAEHAVSANQESLLERSC